MDLRKPGWLPTAIVVNILTAQDERRGEGVHTRDLIAVRDETTGSHLQLPEGFDDDGWQPQRLHPLEVIDGQHRLWAFEDWNAGEQFHLPVVAFQGLDISWQAYLFWTINIKPKRINASLAFDLVPLLRTEDWLERFGLKIYRETRAQELTEALWSNSESPWFERINMLGERGGANVTQAAWIRSLTGTFFRGLDRRTRLGGLFGATLADRPGALPWARQQQAAILLHIWQSLAREVETSNSRWAQGLRKLDDEASGDAAFVGRYSLLNTDQGVRGVLTITNDLLFVDAETLKLWDWVMDPTEQGAVDEMAVQDALRTLRRIPAGKFLSDLAATLASFDWRTSGVPGLSEKERTAKAAFRGSGGYRELRNQLLQHVAAGKGAPARDAAEVADRLGIAAE